MVCWINSLGYTILDPGSREPVDIGPVSVPSYANGEGAFAREDEEERKARDEYAKGTYEGRVVMEPY